MKTIQDKNFVLVCETDLNNGQELRLRNYKKKKKFAFSPKGKETKYYRKNFYYYFGLFKMLPLKIVNILYFTGHVLLMKGRLNEPRHEKTCLWGF